MSVDLTEALDILDDFLVNHIFPENRMPPEGLLSRDAIFLMSSNLAVALVFLESQNIY